MYQAIVSHKAKKYVAGHKQQISVLFTGSTAVKYINALNKSPLKLSLSYQRLSMI